MWFKSKSPLPPPRKREKTATAEEQEVTTGCLAIRWYRKAQDDYKDHPRFRQLYDKYGPMQSGLYGQISWPGFEPLKDLYLYYVNNKEEFPVVENQMSDEGSDTSSNTDQDKIEDEQELKVPIDLESVNFKSSICNDEGEDKEGRGQRKKQKTTKYEQYTNTDASTKTSAKSTNGTSTKKSAKTKQLALGVHLCQVSTKGKLPICKYCHISMEERGEWHAVQVIPAFHPGLPAAARNERHYHFKCVLGEFSGKEITQLIAIVKSNREINDVDSNIIIQTINKSPLGDG